MSGKRCVGDPAWALLPENDADERLYTAVVHVSKCDADLAAGGQGVQRGGGLRLTRVRGVPLAGEALGFGEQGEHLANAKPRPCSERPRGRDNT